jgi:hypothetical protein
MAVLVRREAEPAFSDEEGLIVHSVQVWWRLIGMRRHGDLHSAEPIVRPRTVLQNTNVNRSDVESFAVAFRHDIQSRHFHHHGNLCD